MSVETDKPRDLSIDALRGFAVLGMVLSGSIAFGDVLPAWMFHAQVPPPLHQFNPNIPGITWVDWVFPFFLFAMGAAMPLAFARYGEAGPSHREIWLTALRRGAVLAFLAIFTHQLRAHVQLSHPAWPEHASAMTAFFICGLALATRIGRWSNPVWLRVAAVVVAIALLLRVRAGNPTLTLAKSDIILIVLANMAFFGTLLFAYTRGSRVIMSLVLFAVGATWLAGQASVPIADSLYRASPAPWLYQFDYLKYLFVVVPGMLAGGLLLRADAPTNDHGSRRWPQLVLASACLAVVVGVTAGLFVRSAAWVIGVCVASAGALIWLARESNTTSRHVLLLGALLTAVGLALEPWAGGIKKDPSHFTYWFTTSGFACFVILAIRALETHARRPLQWIAEVGQNPLPAYVVGNLLLIPAMHLTGTYAVWAAMKQNASMGLAKGALFTLGAASITIAMVRVKWIWRS